MNIRTYSNRFISTFQSAVRHVLADEGERIDNLCAEHPVMQATCSACDAVMNGSEHDHTHKDHVDEPADTVEKSDLMRECARLYVGLIRAKMMGDQALIAELEDEIKFSVCDPFWAKVLLEYRKDQDAPIPYRRYATLDDFVEPLPAKQSLKIAFVSDWGTGTATARNVLRCIAEHEPDVFIHLGDVYYSGTQREMDENFLQIVRETLPPTVQVRALAGNHDLYAGGAGYYWLLDELGQSASYFCLRNDDWQILAIGAPPKKESPHNALTVVPAVDTQEVAWHKHKLATANGRKTIMLSHYQLFTASGNIGRTADKRPLALNPAFYSVFQEDLAEIDLWLWGHEHNLIVFDPFMGLERGRCIGSGALPVPLLWQPYKPLPNLVLPDGVTAPPHIKHDAQAGHDGDHYNHGYCVLTLTGDQGEAVYYEVVGVAGDSRPLYAEII